METTEILKNIGEKTGGDIYLGIVGPVRVGKSTFIKKFMEQAVIPYVEDEYEKGRMIDELPQSGEGKTIKMCIRDRLIMMLVDHDLAQRDDILDFLA